MSAGEEFRWLREVRDHDRVDVGGKAAGLGELSQIGCSVPPGFVIPRRYRECWLEDQLPSSFASEVAGWCGQLGARFYAVRSSASIEDGADASWAGQFETFLGVKSDFVVNRVVDCWSSLTSVHALAYGAQHGINPRETGMAAIVQEMIPSEISGVLFTVDPMKPESGLCCVEAVSGLGQVLVQGEVTPQFYSLDRTTGSVVSERVHRQRNALRLSGAGLSGVPLPPGYVLPLRGDTLRELVKLGLRLEQHFGTPQDIEWTCVREILTVVQSRPITTLA
jgi:rifampicin phosphotransferase